ncbi:uncharacterized protein LOC134771644 [Penaeus indicus]|uniref:uncharacterized protein LOC134771644 n=1 Tax=Penaeus indicus TaxID=29960 RepID=UPI00300D81C5
MSGTETWPIKKGDEKKVEVAEMQMLRWMCGMTKNDRIRSETIWGTVKVALRIKATDGTQISTLFSKCGYPRQRSILEQARTSGGDASRNLSSPRSVPGYRWTFKVKFSISSSSSKAILLKFTSDLFFTVITFMHINML